MKIFQKRGMRRFLWVVLGLGVAIVGYGLLQLIEPVGLAPITSASEPIGFSGRALLVASDADMAASAYADGNLQRINDIEDTLSVVSFPLQSEQAPTIAPVSVSNSVMSWPQIIAVSPDGQRAYVVEVRSPPDPDVEALDDIEEMPSGQRLTVIDIADVLQPTVLESVSVGRNPQHISISPDGQFLAINVQEPDHDLVFVQLQPDGRLGDQWSVSLPDSAAQTGEGAVIWHPSGEYLAMTQGGGRVEFYAVQTTENGVSITPYGAPLNVGNHLSHARFTRDGRFLLVPDLKWRTRGQRLLDYLTNPPGEMIAIQFEPESGEPPSVVSRVEVGLSPEGFALSPDNRLIATVNMRRTYLSNLPPIWRGKGYSSLTLLSFDPSTGELIPLDEYGFEGVLPEQATFDASGQYLAVVIFHQREPNPLTGSVELWRVEQTTPRLERLGMEIDVVRGAHDIVLLP